MLKSHIRTIDRFRDIEQTLIFGYLKCFFITIVSFDLTNYWNLMKLHNQLDNLAGNNVLKFHICMLDRFRDIKQTLILGYLEFIPKIIKIHK